MARWNQTSRPGSCDIRATYCRGFGFTTLSWQSCRQTEAGLRRAGPVRSASHNDQSGEHKVPARAPPPPPNGTADGRALSAQVTPYVVRCRTEQNGRAQEQEGSEQKGNEHGTFSSCKVSSAMRPLLGNASRSVSRASSLAGFGAAQSSMGIAR